MPEARSRVVHKILEQSEDAAKSYTKERQLSAQALSLNIERRDGLSAEGFSWAYYKRHRWMEQGGRETLVVLFDDSAIEIQGHNLKVLVEGIRDGQLNGIREIPSGQAAVLRQANPDNEPIIESVKCYPEFDEILKEIKGENDDKARFTRRIER